MIQLRLSISGMHCDGCVQSIRRAMATLPGVQSCDVELGGAEVTLDVAETGKDAVIAAVRGAGDYDIDGFTIAR